jgi:hypothetical protein
VSVVGCSHTTWLEPRAPQELKVELSVQDASVPPTGVRPSGSICRALRTQQSPRWPTVLRRLVEPPASRLTPRSPYTTMK